MTTPHDVLGVKPGAPASEVQAAFRRYAARHHPDHGGDVAVFLAGQDAYRALTGGHPDERVADTGSMVTFHRRRNLTRAVRRALSITTHRLTRRPVPPLRVR